MRPGVLVREASVLARSRVEPVSGAVVSRFDVIATHFAISTLRAIHLEQLRELTKLAECWPLFLRVARIACLHEVGDRVAAEGASEGPLASATVNCGLCRWAFLASGAQDAILSVLVFSVVAWGARQGPSVGSGALKAFRAVFAGGGVREGILACSAACLLCICLLAFCPT